MTSLRERITFTILFALAWGIAAYGVIVLLAAFALAPPSATPCSDIAKMFILPFGVLAPVLLVPAAGLVRWATGRWSTAILLWTLPAIIIGTEAVINVVECNTQIGLGTVGGFSLLAAPLAALYVLYLCLKQPTKNSA